MKIQIFSYVFWPESFLINELAEELQKRGNKVSVITSLPNYSTGQISRNYSLLRGPFRELFHGVEVIRYPVIARKKGFFNLALNYASNVFVGVVRGSFSPRAEVSFVFATSPIFTVLPAIFRRLILGTPLVVWYQDLWPESFLAVARVSQNSIFAKVLESLVRWIYRHIDVMLIQSPAFAENLSRLDFKGRVIHVPNWAPEVKQNREVVPGWVDELPRDRFLVCFAGNLGKAQALNFVVKAAVSLQDTPISFVFVGDGSEAQSLKEFCEDAKLKNIIFTGRKPLQEMPYLFDRCDLLLVSLAKDPLFALTIPSKMQAYMASGKPILGFLDGVGEEIIREAQCGFTAPAESSDLLAACLRSAVQCPSQELKQMGQRAREYYLKHYEKVKIIDTIESVLKEMQ